MCTLQRSIEEERLELDSLYPPVAAVSHMDCSTPGKDRPVEEEVLGILFMAARATGRLPVLTERTYGKS